MSIKKQNLSEGARYNVILNDPGSTTDGYTVAEVGTLYKGNDLYADEVRQAAEFLSYLINAKPPIQAAPATYWNQVQDAIDADESGQS